MESSQGYEFAASVSFAREGKRECSEDIFASHLQFISRRFYTFARRLGWVASDEGMPEPVVEEWYVEPQPHLLMRNSRRVEDAFNGAGVEQESLPSPVFPAKDFLGGSAIRIPDDWKSYFEHIYDRDDQILEIIESLKTARDTDMVMRNHIVANGPPGCGKTDTALAIYKMLGKDSVRRLDATSMTKAGAEQFLLDMDVIPPVLIIEELEKANPANLSWLMGIMDERGEIIKTNARQPPIIRHCPMLIIATVNNINKFESFMDGAINDRFNVPLYFSMPDRNLLRRIALREVRKLPDGNEAWVEPALDFALNVEKTYKARRIKAIMTNGRARLLTGEYQESQIRMAKMRASDKEALREFGLEDCV
jgi:MoxR-like ATPase